MKLLKLKTLAITFILSLLIAPFNILGETEPYINVTYSVNLDLAQKRMSVRAHFSNVRHERMWIGFSNINENPNMKDRLSDRIHNVAIISRAATMSFKQEDDRLKLYEIKANNDTEFIISYTMDTARISDRDLITQITDSKIFIPGSDFFIRTFENLRDIYHHIGFECIHQYTLHFENLPPDWEVLSTFQHITPHTVVINNRLGSDVLISAGKYEIYEIDPVNARILIAIDLSLHNEMEPFIAEITRIVMECFNMYHNDPRSKFLLVIDPYTVKLSPLSHYFKSQVTRQNIKSTVGWGYLYSQREVHRLLLEHLSQTSHNMWLSVEFNMDKYWQHYNKGLSDYMGIKTLNTLDILSKNFMYENLAENFIRYNRFLGAPLSPSGDVTRVNELNPETIALHQSQAMLAAYLLDKELMKKGKSLEQFLSDFYNIYGLSKIQFGKNELMNHINKFLESDRFSERYLLSSTAIDSSDMNLSWTYYVWMLKAYLPSLPLVFYVSVLFSLFIIILIVTYKKRARKKKKK